MNDILKIKNNELSINSFAVAIRGSWNKAIESVIDTAQMVKRAEDQLDRKQLNELKRHLEQERIMSGPTFSKLAKIASNPVLINPENMPLLPPSYATLYELAQYDTSVIQDALSQGSIHAAIKHKDVSNLLPKRPPNRLRKTTLGSKVSVSIHFSSDKKDIPNELLERLKDVLKDINKYVEIKQSGIDT